MNGKLFVAALIAASVFFPGLAQAVDGIAVEAGHGNGVDMARVSVQWNWKQRWLERGSWHLAGYWNLGIGQWHRDALPGQNENITEIGITPVLRYQQNSLRGFYIEGGIGAHVLSESTIGSRQFGSLFQFGDHVGAGYRFGDRGQLDVGYRFQHLSNASIKRPNEGINFHQVRLRYHY